MRLCWLACALAALPAISWAQAANVVTQAEDAFGERVGLERIGLYSESQVRGFSLATAGNYRIEDAYYVPQLTLPNPLIGGVITRVGWNALGADFPAPSGIVEFRLKSAQPGSRLFVEAGVTGDDDPYVDLSGSAATQDGEWGVTVGATLRPRQRWTDHVTREDNYAVGIVPEWRPNPTTSVKLFAGGYYAKFPGDFGFAGTSVQLPRFEGYPGRFQASWAKWRTMSFNSGVIAKTRKAGWDLQSSLIYSWFELAPGDFTLLTIDEEGRGRGLGIYSYTGVNYALAGEVKASRRFGRHRVFAMLRARENRMHLPNPAVFDLGPFDIARPTPASALPVIAPVTKFEDLSHQVTGGLGYQVRPSDRLQLRAGVQKTRYIKKVTQATGLRTENQDSPWLYDLAAVYALSDDWTAFATLTRGLEESGSAPQNAANRYQVLPPVIAKQYEVGVRGRLTPRLSLIGSAFEVRKPTAGFTTSGAFALVGEERHRGVEVSLTGQIRPGLTLVAGAVIFDADLDLSSVGFGRVRPVGVSRFLAQASFNYEVPKVKGLSIDGGVNHGAGQLMNPFTGLEIPSLTTATLGARYTFSAARRPTTLRVYVSNLTDVNQWTGSKSGLVWPTFPRQVRATLSTTFD